MSAVDPVALRSAPALELLPDGAVLVDEHRHVVATNEAFRTSVRRQRALDVRGHVLAATQASVAARLADRVAAVLRDGRERVLRVPVPGDPESLELRIAPFGASRAFAVILVHDAVSARPVCPARLRELYELTRAEAEVATRLAGGASLEGVAEQLGVSLNTVRTHLRRLFAKCGVGTQGALLQRLALGAARVGFAAGAGSASAGDDRRATEAAHA